MSKTLVRMMTTRGTWLYVKSVSWGSGTQAKSVKLTTDRSEAFGFSVAMAEIVAKQYYNRRVELVREDGSVNAESSAHVSSANAESREAVRKVVSEFDAALDSAIPEDLRRAVFNALNVRK